MDSAELKSLLEQANISQKELAKMMGLKTNLTVWRWCAGKYPIPNEKTLLIRMLLYPMIKGKKGNKDTETLT